MRCFGAEIIAACGRQGAASDTEIHIIETGLGVFNITFIGPKVLNCLRVNP
jgi:hypothetical protein